MDIKQKLRDIKFILWEKKEPFTRLEELIIGCLQVVFSFGLIFGLAFISLSVRFLFFEKPNILFYVFLGGLGVCLPFLSRILSNWLKEKGWKHQSMERYISWLMVFALVHIIVFFLLEILEIRESTNMHLILTFAFCVASSYDMWKAEKKKDWTGWCLHSLPVVISSGLALLDVAMAPIHLLLVGLRF